MEKRRPHADTSVESCESLSRAPVDSLPNNAIQGHLDQEKRVRREIANSNERRRMQSINAGFDSLRILLPPIPDGEKMSKAMILQLTAKYINTLLMRVKMLENEVAIYRQTTGVQTNSILPDLQEAISISRKRKSDDLRKRSECVRSRRRRVELDSVLDSTTRIDFTHCPPDVADIHQTSPTSSFTGSHSVSPISPQPESTSSTTARLEHLVMAIEQIEGGGALNVSPQPESHDGSFSNSDQSPPETYWHSPQESYHDYVYTETPTSNHKSNLNPFSDVLMLTPVSEVNTPISITSINDTPHVQPSSEDYPIVAKLLNRPIPHKYLHRPQVVVNSSH